MIDRAFLRLQIKKAQMNQLHTGVIMLARIKQQLLLLNETYRLIEVRFTVHHDNSIYCAIDVNGGEAGQDFQGFTVSHITFGTIE